MLTNRKKNTFYTNFCDNVNCEKYSDDLHFIRTLFPTDPELTQNVS